MTIKLQLKQVQIDLNVNHFKMDHRRYIKNIFDEIASARN